jgi:hypothetical protein
VSDLTVGRIELGNGPTLRPQTMTPQLADLMAEQLAVSKAILGLLERLAGPWAPGGNSGTFTGPDARVDLVPDPEPPPPALACPNCGSEELEHQQPIGAKEATYFCEKGHVFMGPPVSEEQSE